MALILSKAAGKGANTILLNRLSETIVANNNRH
jgi:hypothetical protein